MLTGRKAHTLDELLHLLKTCRDSSIFYHTFSAFMRMREIRMPYNSDFANWIANDLNEKALAEKLMAIDLFEYNTLETLRHRIIAIVEQYKSERPEAFHKKSDESFFLYDIQRVVYLTDKFAYDLPSFRQCLSSISIYSIYFHFIESRLEKDLHADDFSHWIEADLEMPKLARAIQKIDLNVYTMEELRARIIGLIDESTEARQP